MAAFDRAGMVFAESLELSHFLWIEAVRKPAFVLVEQCQKLHVVASYVNDGRVAKIRHHIGNFFDVGRTVMRMPLEGLSPQDACHGLNPCWQFRLPKVLP